MASVERKRPRVVLLHGAGGGAWEWRVWGRVFTAAGVDVLAPDLQPADTGVAATTLDDYRRQVEALAGEGGVFLVGASLGGWLALSASARVEPSARILVNPVPPAGVPGWPPERRDFPEVIPWGSQPGFEATRRSLPDGDWHAHRLAHRNWRDESGRVMSALHAGAAVESFTTPTLVIASERDGDVPPSVSRTLATELGADFILIPGASHLGPLLGDSAIRAAEQALAWLQVRLGP